MEPDIAQDEGQVAEVQGSISRHQLIEFIADNTGALLGSIRSYVQRMGLAGGEKVANVAVEVLQEVVIEALDHVERFDPTRQPMAWLLGIALNIIKRKRVEVAKRQQREWSIARLRVAQSEPLSEEEMLDQLSARTSIGPEQDVEEREQARLILSLVSAEDQQILRMAFVLDFEREALAKELGITPVAARVRLHRALGRLRTAWHEQCGHSAGEEQSRTAKKTTGRSKQ